VKYRSEIDGLRAFAVLPVILFHAGFQWFSGGYVGVDIFFVISGYLITSIIINEIEAGTFSITNFYERRARRILPALTFVCLVCLPFAWLYLPPEEMKKFAHSLMAVFTFSSNILFWTEVDYFDTASELKPLLHTWSLAVEEQYYIFFPPLLVFLWKYKLKTVLLTLFIMFVGSLALGHWAVFSKPSAAFFLLPTRGWEILLGCFCAFYLKYSTFTVHNHWQNILSLLGFALILVAIFGFQVTTPTPSLYTLIPTLGVALIVLFANPNTLINRCLSWRPFVAIGLISYSAYLWHQPIFAFARKILQHEISSLMMIALSCLALVLGWVSWRTIEKPFRSKSFLSTRSIFSYSGAITLVFISMGLWGHLANGFLKPQHTSDYVSAIELDKQHIYLLGDSHAGHLLEGLNHATTGKIIKRTASGCIPLLHVDRMDSRGSLGACANSMTASIEEFVGSSDYDTLLVSAMGPVYLEGTSFRNKDKARVLGNKVTLMTDLSIKDNWTIYETGMRKTFTLLERYPNKHVYFVLDIPELGIDAGCNPSSKSISVNGYEIKDAITIVPPDQCKIPRAEYEQRVSKYRNLVAQVSKDYPSIHLVDLEPLFCDAQWCQGYKEKVGYLYADADHLSVSGSNYVAEFIAREIQTHNAR